jgi:hypothetical protein
MIRLHAVVEGLTEKAFVDQVLGPELGMRNVIVDSRETKTGRHRGQDYRGGLSKYVKLKNDLTLWMKQDQQPDAWFTTMVDFYALPDDFPGFSDCAKMTHPSERVECLEDRLARDFDHRRFIPYIQLHEFEALLFSDPGQFENEFSGTPSAARQLIAIRNQFPTPEDINDSPDFAPSKRILKILPDYRKNVTGPAIAKRIGLPTLRRECRHFNSWIERIEAASQ